MLSLCLFLLCYILFSCWQQFSTYQFKMTLVFFTYPVRKLPLDEHTWICLKTRMKQVRREAGRA